MSFHTFKCKPIYLLILLSLSLGACASFPNNNYGSSNANYNGQAVGNSELDSLTQSLKNADDQIALNKMRKQDSSYSQDLKSKNSNSTQVNSENTASKFNSASKAAVYASQYSKNNNQDLASTSIPNNDNNVIITIERPHEKQNSEPAKSLSNINLNTSDSNTLVDNRSENNFTQDSSNVIIQMAPKPSEPKMNTFDIVDDTPKQKNSFDLSSGNLVSETTLSSNFASRNTASTNNFKVNLDWNDSVDLLFTKLSDKAGYKYATINHPRKNMVVSIHGEALSFDDILRQAGSQISNCFDVVKIQSEGVFTLKPRGICQIN